MAKLVLSVRGYPSVILRQVMAISAAYFLVIFGEEIDSMAVIRHPNFLPAMLGSYLIAYVLIEYTHWMTHVLDGWKRFWQHPKHGFLFRVLAQIVVVMLLSRQLAVRLAEVYFKVGYDINPADTSYPIYEIHFITALLGILNIIYLACYYIRRQREPIYVEVLESQPLPSAVALLPSGEHGAKEGKEQKIRLLDRVFSKPILWEADTLLMGVPLESIAYFACENDAYFFYTFENECLGWDRSLNRTIVHLPANQYMRVTKNLIINRKAYAGHEEVKYYCWKLKLIPPYPGDTKLSRKKTAKMREWLDK